MKREAPSSGKTRRAPGGAGTLRQSIKKERISKLTWHIIVNAPYGRFVEYGTKGGTIIRPVKRKVLADKFARRNKVPDVFWSRKLGIAVYGTKVTRGKTEPNPFVARTVDRVKKEVEGDIEQEMDKTFKRYFTPRQQSLDL